MTTLPLSEFNNLSKTLVCNLYQLCYVEDYSAYQQYIYQYDNSDTLSRLLKQLAKHINAHIVHISAVDYQPQGTSLNLLLAESSLDAHLDKSHIHLHTYPDQNPNNNIYAFRVDIDIATCGDISPLSALRPLLDIFPVSVMRLDYHLRGFSRDINSKPCYQDQPICGIAAYLSPAQRQHYRIRQQQFTDLRANYAHFLSLRPQRQFIPAGQDKHYQKQIQQDMLALYLTL